MSGKSLGGLRVLEWGQMVAAPYCAKLLADLGAEVIKVEPPAGDAARRHGPFLHDIPHPERSGLFLYANTSKLGVTLDVASPRGGKILREMLKDADIFIEDAPPAALERLGLRYDDLKRLNPRLVQVAITPFGLTGPYKDYKAYPLNTYHASGEGFMTPTGSDYPERAPVKAGNFVGEYEVGVNAAGAALAALYWREESGQGQIVDISAQEALLLLAASDMTNYAQFGAVTGRSTRNWPFGRLYRCQDGYAAFITLTKRHRAALFTLLDYPDWQKDERLLDQTWLEMHSPEVEVVIERLLAERTRAELFSRPQANDFPSGPSLRPGEVMKSAQFAARGFFTEIEHPETGKLKYPSAPYQFSETPWRVERPAPLLGQHNEEVYCQRLGYTRDDLARLRGLHVI
ncbi:MAG: CoA transferase [Chloroflexi bacterium]|nr:CoA transferase [Chloroflexota bacterium]